MKAPNTPALYRLASVRFPYLRLSQLEGLGKDIELEFAAKGRLSDAGDQLFVELHSCVRPNGNDHDLARAVCLATIEFKQPQTRIHEQPDGFFSNVLALIFPYVRAILSSVTVQAGWETVVWLPTLYLSGVAKELKKSLQPPADSETETEVTG